jgi:hypothetical protein
MSPDAQVRLEAWVAAKPDADHLSTVVRHVTIMRGADDCELSTVVGRCTITGPRDDVLDLLKVIDA